MTQPDPARQAGPHAAGCAPSMPRMSHWSYCFRYRVDSQNSSTPDSAAGNVGFRCVRNA